jgi:hypothetical protein
MASTEEVDQSNGPLHGEVVERKQAVVNPLG